jgi:hypothetical protein
VGFLVAAQVGLLTLLSDRTPVTPRQPPPSPRFSLAPDRAIEHYLAQHLAADDPTLLGLVNPRGFSGPAWLSVPAPTHELRAWAEPPRWLAPEVDALGAGLWRVVRVGGDVSLSGIEKPAPEFLTVELPTAPLPVHSTLHLEGDLAARPLAAPLELPDWPSSELLTNSVVQLAVNAAGEVFCATLLSVRGLKGAEQKAADARAVTLARGARFKPLPLASPAVPPGAAVESLSWGTIVFRWHTLPLPTPATNATAQAALTP